MRQLDPHFAEHQRLRFMRPDAGRYLKPMPHESWRDFERRCAHAEGREPRLELTRSVAKQQPAVTDASLDEAMRGLAELKWLVADLRLHLLRRELAAKAYNRNQPRVPAGNPDGGQWTDDGALSTDISAAKRVSGGIARKYWSLTARQFISRFCTGNINRELPGQFEDVTIGDIIEIARGGDKAAKKCYKLLNEPRFRKR